MCEECWRDASRDALLMGGTTVDRYEKLVKERQSDAEHVARNTVRSTPEATAFVHGDDDEQAK